MQGRKAALVPAAAIVAAGGLVVAALAVPSAAVVMWALALVLVVTALVAAFRRTAGVSSKAKGIVASVAFVAAAALGFSVAWSAVGAVSTAGAPGLLEPSVDL